MQLTEAGFLSNELPNCTSEAAKARPFIVAKNSIAIFKTA
jgi:hypothetical protein